MNTLQIIETVSEHKKISRRTFYNLAEKLGIKPISMVRQHPQLYPNDSAERILKHFGFSVQNGNGSAYTVADQTYRQTGKAIKAGQILSLSQLKKGRLSPDTK